MIGGVGGAVVVAIGGMAGAMVFARKRKQNNEKPSGVQGYPFMSLCNYVWP